MSDQANAVPPAPPPAWRSFLSLITLRSPFWRQSYGHRFLRGCVSFFYFYVAVCIVLMCLENRILYPGSGASDWYPPPKTLMIEDVWYTLADGTKIHGWWAAPSDWKPEDGAVLWCHGNAGNLSYRGHSMIFWVQTGHMGVLLFDYPGYGKSTGTATEASCCSSADAGYDWLVKERKVSGERIILYGGSLGGGVAIDLASRRPHRALLVVSTFTSFADMAQTTFWFLPARWMVTNKYDNLAKIAECKKPTFFIHSKADGLIPFAMGQKLYEASPGPKEFYAVENHFHHDGGSNDAFGVFREFLKKHEK